MINSVFIPSISWSSTPKKSACCLHFLVFLMNEWSTSIQGFKAENLSLADRTNVFYFAISIQQDSEIPMILYFFTAFK